MVEDWVNAQDEELERRTDNTRPGSVRENDEILWQEFEAAFKGAWTDTTKVQSAYSQLMNLKMKDLDIDTYNATFARLANAAGWEADAKGTIDRYRSGLREAIQRRVINRDKMPDSMDEWQTRLVKKSPRSKSFRVRDSSEPAGTRHHVTDIPTRTRVNALTQIRRTVSTSQWTSMPPILLFLLRNSLMKSEHNTEPRDGVSDAEPKGTWLVTARKTLTRRTFRANETSTPEKLQSPLLPTQLLRRLPSSTPSVPPPPPPKLSYAQQIRALEAKMSDEERSLYLDARDMGEDFCSAGL
jgi:hypothetical protein